MSDIETMRAFNRSVTRTLGVFDKNYLGRPRPLAASRLLFEIGEEGEDLKTLRERMGIDSGYLSRLLRKLEKESLITIQKHPSDGRSRIAILGEKGLEELKTLHRLSDQQADTTLSRIPQHMKSSLVESMDTITRIMESVSIELIQVKGDDPRAQAMLKAYYADLSVRFDTTFDPSADAHEGEYDSPQGIFCIVLLFGKPVGCGALRFFDDFAEVKKVWIDPNYRRRGIASKILLWLEKEVSRTGYDTIRLDTNESLEEAIGLYKKYGYAMIDRYNDNPYAQYFFEKRLTVSS